MSKTIARERLIKAFAKWSEDYKLNPQDYLAVGEGTPEQSADYLIELLDEIE